MSDNLNNVKENKNGTKITVVQTAFFMAILTLISKLLGFVREMVIAGFFGTSYVVDAYVMAQAIPGMLFGGLFVSIGTAYMPTFSGIVEKKGEVEGNKFTNQIINFLLVITTIAFFVGFFLSEELVAIIAKDFSVKTAELTVFYLKITFGYTIFSCAASILDAYMQYKGKFLQPIISGYFQNIGIIVFAIISAYTSHYYLAFGMLIGYAMRLLYIFLMAKKENYRYRIEVAFNQPVKQIVTLAIPVFISFSITQLNTFVDKMLASGLVEGSIAALNYGMKVVDLITALTTAIIATIIYPKITKAVSNKEWDFFNIAVEKGMTLLIIIAVPFSLGGILFSEEVVQVVYERGAFDEDATALTASAFLFYASGLLFIALNTLLTQVYYSMRDMKTPVKCALVSVTTNIVLNLILIDGMQHKGLALSTSIAAGVNFLLLYLLLLRKYKQVKIFKSKKKLIKICCSAIIAVTFAVVAYEISINLIWAPRIIYLGCAVLIASIIYLGLLMALKVDDINILKDIIKRK